MAALEISPDGRLWVADSGTAAVFAAPVKRCPAKIVAFDIERRNPTEVYRCCGYRYSFTKNDNNYF